MEDLVPVHLSRVVIQEKDDSQFIFLKEEDGERMFPIVIGFNEVAEINRKLHAVDPPRPMTHDLIGKLLRELGWELRRVVVTDLKRHTFYAVLVIGNHSDEREIDCRPSDAIALAVQLDAPIFVNRKVLDQI